MYENRRSVNDFRTWCVLGCYYGLSSDRKTGPVAKNRDKLRIFLANYWTLGATYLTRACPASTCLRRRQCGPRDRAYSAFLSPPLAF